MKINSQDYEVKGVRYTIRPAASSDAAQLSELRFKLDGETEFFDREPGEAFMDADDFAHRIEQDTASPVHLMLSAVADGRLVGYARCAGSELKRVSHQVEFGVGVLQAWNGYGIGYQLLQQCIAWARQQQLRKIKLQVLETNLKAIELYTQAGFEVEGILQQDKRLSDEQWYSTLLMAKFL
ncbi:GNAT family N-acetyltransferase [Paenibacillus sp. JX-17]|uniref:GNAT family N-acetyltransferase n=1 Tax=Paenibacillus lacisoli TaxID=3064525 RepID=A0ABT9CI80_9BACL|nr:GNAT family N-acetyltransferase [Paenibacillus sp. JX-17]MDO7907647.1 GNAT family N-acetyltransferase [Paenibacillus sp. JX-17]